MTFFWAIWLVYVLILLAAKTVYESNKDRDRLLIEQDTRFFQHYVIRPLFLLGEKNCRYNRRNSLPGYEPPLSILPPRPHNLSLPAKQVIETPPGAKLTIQHRGQAHRCEICHQDDRFDAETGNCQRCDHRTL